MPPFISIELQLPLRPLDLHTPGHTPINSVRSKSSCGDFVEQYSGTQLWVYLERTEKNTRKISDAWKTWVFWTLQYLFSNSNVGPKKLFNSVRFSSHTALVYCHKRFAPELSSSAVLTHRTAWRPLQRQREMDQPATKTHLCCYSDAAEHRQRGSQQGWEAVTRTAFHPGVEGLCPTRTQTKLWLEYSLMKIPTFL